MELLRLRPESRCADHLLCRLQAHTRERAVAGVPVSKVAAERRVVGRGEMKLQQRVRHVPAGQAGLCSCACSNALARPRKSNLDLAVVERVLARGRVVRLSCIEDDLKVEKIILAGVPVLEHDMVGAANI